MRYKILENNLPNINISVALSEGEIYEEYIKKIILTFPEKHLINYVETSDEIDILITDLINLKAQGKFMTINVSSTLTQKDLQNIEDTLLAFSKHLIDKDT